MKSKCQQTRIKNMTKKIIFIMAAFCSLQVRAAVQSPESDTVRCMSLYEGFELFQPLQPSYLDGVIVPVHGSGNWFVSMAGGVTAFLGTPLGCEDLFGRIKPSYSLAVGKWFTPAVGARINYSGLQFKDCMLSTQNYHHVHADLMWNLLGSRYAKQDKVRWGLSPFAGVGLVHNATNGNNPFALSYGIQGQYRFSQRVSAIVELSGMTTFQDFDGYGRVNRLGDHMLTLSAGLAFHIGKVGWKRVVDAVPYIRQNEFLTDYSNTLSEKNRQYAKSLDMDRRTLAELKKILEIEGLLDTYSHLFDVDEDSGRSTYPKNNYSGLNSLRARLRNRNWDGKSLLEGQKASDEIHEGSLQDSCDSVNAPSKVGDGTTNESDRFMAADDTSFMQQGSGCIGSPIFFFFKLGTSQLTDASQLINLEELARVAKRHRLTIKVTGAADSATGTPAINDSLSISRASYIIAELKRLGIPENAIVSFSRGGIADYTPAVEANRHTKVELFLSNIEEIKE